ncbi:hypothetical protein RWE87_05080 [Sinorhizobium meliloti]|uniref:hypothetical protein n=1 Tax=Rhizobium meliloti TaxID=382 RepID=UPI00299DFCB9|nr:hypothetical protein [Sinorhizobium meliloti]
MINLDGVTYEILGEKKIAGFSSRVEIMLRRPRGKRVYHAVRYEDGSISSAV